MLDKRTYDRTCHYQTFYRCQWYVHQQIECTANLTISFDSPTSIHSPSEFAVSVALLTSCILVFRVFLDSSLKNCRFLQQWGSRGSISALWTSRWSIPALPRCCERRIHIETVIDSQPRLSMTMGRTPEIGMSSLPRLRKAARNIISTKCVRDSQECRRSNLRQVKSRTCANISSRAFYHRHQLTGAITKNYRVACATSASINLF